MPTINLRLNESANPRYIHIDEATNTVHLMVPIATGININADNTCKTVVALQEFFGKGHDSQTRENSAYFSLLKYKRSLEDDIAIMTDGIEKTQKQERLTQTDQYIQAFNQIKDHHTLNDLTRGYPIYPTPVREILRRPTNLYGMTLCPTVKDGFLNVQAPVFSVARDAGRDVLYRAFMQAFNGINQVPMHSPEERLIDSIVSKITNDTITIGELQTLVNNSPELKKLKFTIEASDLAAVDCTDPNELLKKNVSAQNSDSLRSFLQSIIAANLQRNPNLYPYNAFHHIKTLCDAGNIRDIPEYLSITSQFLLAEINIHARSLGLSIANFGAVLDANIGLSTSLANDIRNAVITGQEIDTCIMSFINRNQQTFGLARILNANEINTITTEFHKHFFLIKDAPHLDEFMILKDNLPRQFYHHQGSLCFDFAQLAATQDFPLLSLNPIIQRIQGQNPNFSTTNDLSTVQRTVSAVGEIPIDDSVIKQNITTALQTNNFTSLRRILLSPCNNDKKVFQVISPDFFSPHNNHPLLLEVRRSITDAALMKNFNRIVLNRPEPQLLSADETRNLYMGIMKTKDINISLNLKYSNVRDLTDLLNAAGIRSVTVTAGYSGTFAFEAANIETLQAINALKDAGSGYIHLTQRMAVSIYKEVKKQYGENSPEYTAMMQKNNQSEIPQKMIYALSLLHIPVPDPENNITYPNNGDSSNGYLIKNLTPDNIRAIENIHHEHGRKMTVDVNMINALCDKLRPLNQQMFNTHNTFCHRDRLRATLAALDIPYIDVTSMNATSTEFSVGLDETSQAIVKKVLGLPFINDEEPLARFYTPHLINLEDRKSNRGHLHIYRTVITQAQRQAPAQVQAQVQVQAQAPAQAQVQTQAQAQQPPNVAATGAPSAQTSVPSGFTPEPLATTSTTSRNDNSRRGGMFDAAARGAANVPLPRILSSQELLTNKIRELCSIIPVIPPGTWFHLNVNANDSIEYGRSRHTGNLCFADSAYQITFEPNATVSIQNKSTGYSQITGEREKIRIFNDFCHRLGLSQAPSATPPNNPGR